MNTTKHTTTEGAGSSVQRCEKHHWQNAFPGDNRCPYCPAPLVLTLPAKPDEQWEAARVANEPKVDAFAGGITVSADDRCEWLRFAKAAYSQNRRDIGNRFSAAGDRLTCAEYDALQTEYRAWLIHGTVA